MNPSDYPRTVITFEEPQQVATAAVEKIIEAAHEAILKRGRFRIALAGGSTPERTYALLAEPQWVSSLDWSRTDVFFGDERMVPLDDPRSNFGMANRALLNQVPAARVFPIPTSGRPAGCAALYAKTLATSFGVDENGPPPRFDLILLGLGDDGHTASLFPGAASLNETKTWVTWSPPGTLPPPVDRVTLTYPVLNAAGAVIFLVTGPNKAEPLRDVLGGAPLIQRPAAGVRPTEGTVTILADEAATAWLRQPVL